MLHILLCEVLDFSEIIGSRWDGVFEMSEFVFVCISHVEDCIVWVLGVDDGFEFVD